MTKSRKQIKGSEKQNTRIRCRKIVLNFKFYLFSQLLNVLKREMSVVGPRHNISGYYDLLKGENRKILELKPGVNQFSIFEIL
jgi:lipopolysaccharide/colanic/teichoic acid biosynthesis glycosyltransferase